MDDYPWDVRVEKFTRSLTAAGHTVHLVCRNLGRLPCRETTRDAIVHRMVWFRNRWLNYVTNFPAFFNPFWLWRIYQVLRTHKTSVVIARDLPLSLTAALIAKITGASFVLDMAENYPAMIRHLWKYGSPRLTDVFVRNPTLVTFVEMVSLRLADHIFVVVDESKQRLVRDGCAREKISVLMNTPILEAVTEPEQELGSECIAGDSEYIAMYVGGLEPGRGLDAVIRAVPYVLKEVPSFRFVIIGAGGAERALRGLVSQLGIDSSVVFAGWIPHTQIAGFLRLSDVCLIPHRPSDHTHTTIPNKLFEYMAAGRPVISSNLAPVRRIIQEEKCGLIVERLTPNEIAQCLIRLKDPEVRKRLGEKGRQAVYQRYNWSAAEKTLVHVIECLASSGSWRSHGSTFTNGPAATRTTQLSHGAG